MGGPLGVNRRIVLPTMRTNHESEAEDGSTGMKPRKRKRMEVQLGTCYQALGMGALVHLNMSSVSVAGG